jgi:hypothetical protein
MSTTSRVRNSQKGSAITEAAFIFLIFAAMLIGAFDFGQFLFVHQALVERARNAIRWGAVNDSSTTEVQNKVLYDQSTVPTTGSGYFGLTSSMVTVTSTAAGTDNARLVVSVHDYPYVMVSPWITGTYTGPNIQVEFPLGQFN